MEFTFETTIQEVIVKGIKKYQPAYIIGGEVMVISHQNTPVICDTKEDAQEYLED